MAQKTLTEVWDDPKFRDADANVQRAVLTKLGVTSDRQDKLLGKLAGAKRTIAPSHTPTPPPVPKPFLERAGERFGETVQAGAMFPAQAAEKVGEAVSGLGKWVGRFAKSETREQALKEVTEAKPSDLVSPWGTTPGARAAGMLTVGPRATYRLGKQLYEDWKGDPAKLVGDVGAMWLLGKAGDGDVAQAERVATRERAAVMEGRVPARIPKPETVAAHEPVTITDAERVKYTNALDKANREYAQDVADYAEKESRRQSQWAQKAYGAKKSVADAEAATAKKQILDRGSEAYTVRAQQNMRDVHQTVRSRLDSRWNEFRNSMSGTEVNKLDVYKIIEDARGRLRGSPADLKQFTDLVREMGIKINDAGEIEVAAGEEMTMPLDTARVHSSAIGDKLAGGGLPGQVYQALKSAKEGIEREIIEPAAEARGQGDVYRALKRDWSQYMRDWKDSDSYLAKAMKAPNATLLRPVLIGKGGDLVLEALGRYRNAGSNPELARQARVLHNKGKGIKAGPVRAMPPEYEPLPPPRLKEVPPPKPSTGPPPVPSWVKATGRIGGKLAGGAVGSLVGHPFLGWATGGEAGQAIFESAWRRRQKAPVPPDLELPTGP